MWAYDYVNVGTRSAQGLLEHLSLEEAMISRILVPTDFSAQADAALAYARLFGKTFNASLHLLHVTPDLPSPHAAANVRDGRLPALKELRDRIPRDPWCRYPTVRLAEGTDPASHITDYANSASIALIVMGTHGRGGVARMVMGSVAETVVRTAPCPVLTVHGAPGSPLMGFRRILVPLDFSAASDPALDAARLLAARFESSLHLLHVLPEIYVDGGSEAFTAEAPQVRTLRLMNARERLTHRIPVDVRPSRVTTEVIFGAPAETIAAYAADNHFDLIVLGTHGRKGMAHLLRGSVAERVVRTAQCPVMTTRTVWTHAEAMFPVTDLVGATA
jgi:nucleotide-binding universal stress UspA family protein